MRTNLKTLLAAAGVLLLVGCASDDARAADDAPIIVATTSIWADVVADLACDGPVEVRTLVPTGGDPHAFEPSLADRALLEDAALIVANGLQLEEALDDTLDTVEADGAAVFRIADHVATIDYSTVAADDDRENDDPHVWLDPARVSDALPALAAALVDQAGLEADAVDACLTSMSAELADLDAEVAGILSAVEADRRLLVTNHDALGYLADRYDFEIIGTVIPTPSGLGATNPAQLERLAQLIEDNGVPAIFAETQHTSDEAQALAERIGDVAVVTLLTGTLGDADSGADTYAGLVRTNARLIADALS